MTCDIKFDKIISHCHPCDYLFIIYHNTRNNRNFVYTYHSHISIYYTSTHCHFLTLQITVCLSCQTQQAMHNALCDVLWRNKNRIIPKKNQKKKSKKNSKTKFKNKISKKIKIPKKFKKKSHNKNSKQKFHTNNFNIFFP